MRDFSSVQGGFFGARVFRAALAIVILAVGFAAASVPASAAGPAEQFISDNAQKGITILGNKQLSKDQRRAQFQDFLLGLADIKAISVYTLGQYRRTASPADIDAFSAAFKDYALAVYQSYFDKFSGQTLQVTGSYPAAPDETVVKSVMNDPKKTNDANPLEVDFRVSSANGRMAVIDFSVGGVWLRETEKSDFTSYLSQNSGAVPKLTAMLKTKAQQMK